MLKKEYELIIPFVKAPWKKYTFKEIKKLCKKTSESYVYNIIKKQAKEGILTEEKVGNVILYSLNLKETKTQIYTGFISEHIGWNTKHLPFDVINKVLAKVPTTYFTFIVTGSYAKNKQKATSDIDFAIIVDDKQHTEHIISEINYACELSIPQGHPYVFKKSEFLEMLLNKDANYGKEVAKNNLIICGGSEYFRIMQEAIKNGFNDKSLS